MSFFNQKIINRTTLVSTALAFLLWGSWAYFVNYDSENALQTFFVQGIYSGSMTLYLSFCTYFILGRLLDSSLKWILPGLITVLHTGFLLYFVHWLNGTQNIILTIAPPLCVGFFYCQFLVLQKLK